MSFTENPRAIIGANGCPEDDTDPPIDIDTADIVERCVRVLSAAVKMHRDASKVLRKKQALQILSMRQLIIYCLTHEDPDLAVVPLVKLAKIIQFDRGTVRDDRKAVEVAVERFPELREFLDTARDMVLAVPALAREAPNYFLNMDIARSKSRERARKLLAEKRERRQILAAPTRGETALRELGMDDLADQLAQQRQAAPWNPVTDAKPEWMRRI